MQLERVDSDDDVLHVKTIGQIAPNSAEQLRDPLVVLLGPQVFERRVSLNLAESAFISSSGIGWLLHLHKRFEQHGGKLALCCVPKEIEQVFQLMRLHSVLHLV